MPMRCDKFYSRDVDVDVVETIVRRKMTSDTVYGAKGTLGISELTDQCHSIPCQDLFGALHMPENPARTIRRIP